MKKASKLLLNCIVFIACTALIVANMSGNIVCPFLYYQPKVAKALNNKNI